MPLKVIGAGLGRTGTLSLKLALEQVGLGPCYHMMEVFPRPHAAGQWLAAANGEPTDWEVVFDGFSSTVDWPSSEFYGVLAERYPDAKVILSTRDADKWFNSTQATIFADPGFDGAPEPFRSMVRAVIGRKFNGRLDDRDLCIDVYNRHNDEVRATIPAERLLEFEASQGWGPLCAFLGVPVPDTPFPSVNSTEEFRARRPGPPAHA